MPHAMKTAATNASGQFVGGLEMPESLPLLSGLVVCFTMIGFVLRKVHVEKMQAAMAGTLSAVAILAPVFLGAIGGAHWRGELPGGAKVESWAKQAQSAAQATSADKERVEELTAEVRGTAEKLEALETRYRAMIGDAASLTYLMWRVRGIFGKLPDEVVEELTRLSNSMMEEAYPDASERSRVIGRINAMSPVGGGAAVEVR